MNYNILNLLGTHIKQRCMFNYAKAGLAVLHQFLHHTRFQTTHVQYVWGPLHAFNIYDSVRSTSFTNANGLPKSGGSADGAVHHSLVTHTHTHTRMTNPEASLRTSTKPAPPIPAGILRAQSPQLLCNASNSKLSRTLKREEQFGLVTQTMGRPLRTIPLRWISRMDFGITCA